MIDFFFCSIIDFMNFISGVVLFVDLVEVFVSCINKGWEYMIIFIEKWINMNIISFWDLISKVKVKIFEIIVKKV